MSMMQNDQETSKILSIIPARGGSKGVPRKNMTDLDRLPLIEYTLQAAEKSGLNLNHVLVSTDSKEIQAYSAGRGFLCDALRPDFLSTDHARTADVVAYELDRLERKYNHVYDTILLLQPTSPLRNSDDIKNSFLMYQAHNQPSLISVYDAEHIHPSIMYKREGEMLTPYDKNSKIQRRQDMDKVYVRNGAIYICNRDYFLQTKSLVSETPSFYEMPRMRSINIDSLEDLKIASFLLKNFRV